MNILDEFLQGWGNYITGLPKDVEIKARERVDICINCTKLEKTTKRCKVCGCFMVAKTRCTDCECPIGKWGKIKYK